MAGPEARIKALVKRLFAEAFPDSYRFMPVQYGMGAPSVDFLFCIDGLFVAVETKAPGKRLTTRQFTVLTQIRKAGGLSYLITKEEDAVDAIRRIEIYRRAINSI